MDDATRPPKTATTGEEAAPLPGEPEAPAVPPPLPTAAPASIAAAARERRSRALDPLAGLAEELSRVPGAPEPGPIDQRQPPRRAPRLPPTGPTPPTTPPAPPVVPTSADAPLTPAADQNLSEMAQRLEAALRRPAKPADKPGDKAADARQPASTPGGPPPSGERDEFAPPPRPSRFESPPRRPFKADDLRASSPPTPPKAAGEPGAAEAEDGAPRPDAVRPGAPEAKPSKSLYDSLEQEMASLLNRPPTKP